MLRFNRLLTVLSLSVWLVSGCLPVVLPMPIVTTPTAGVMHANGQVDQAAAAAAAALPTELLFQVIIDLNQPQNIGSGEMGIRYVSYFSGGTVTGPQLQGTILPDGEIWYVIRRDRIAELLMQGAVQTTDGALITFYARAFSRAASLTTEQLFDAELIDPSDAFFRGVPFFATDAARYDWLNHAVTVATYRYDLQQVVIAIYAIH